METRKLVFTRISAAVVATPEVREVRQVRHHEYREERDWDERRRPREEVKPKKVKGPKKPNRANRAIEEYNKIMNVIADRHAGDATLRKFERNKVSQGVLELKSKKENGEILTASIGDLMKLKIIERSTQNGQQQSDEDQAQEAQEEHRD